MKNVGKGLLSGCKCRVKNLLRIREQFNRRFLRNPTTTVESRTDLKILLESIQELTRGHNIIADGWAGASNPHSHPKPHSMHKHS